MAVRADPLDIPGSDPEQDQVARYKVVGDDLEEPAMMLDAREDGYAAKWETAGDVTTFIEDVETIYVDLAGLRANAMFHPEDTGSGTEVSTDYETLVKQMSSWEEITSLKIVYGPHDAIWMEEAPDTYSIVYSSDVADTDPLEAYFRATSVLNSDTIDGVLESARTTIDQNITSDSDQRYE